MLDTYSQGGLHSTGSLRSLYRLKKKKRKIIIFELCYNLLECVFASESRLATKYMITTKYFNGSIILGKPSLNRSRIYIFQLSSLNASTSIHYIKQHLYIYCHK